MQATNLYIKIKPAQVGLFRFLLEAYDNLAYFTVLEPKTALLKICTSQSQSQARTQALADIGTVIEIEYLTIHKKA